MWLVVISLVAAIVTAVWYAKDEKGEYKLGSLSLILWGTAIMVFVDHLMGYLAEGGEFFEISSDATLLSIVLVIVAFIVWEVYLLLKDPKGMLIKKFKKH
jgi:peptidoglycan biosynthesis protein MviN/MurJ (putative lipid II flippase)